MSCLPYDTKEACDDDNSFVRDVHAQADCKDKCFVNLYSTWVKLDQGVEAYRRCKVRGQGAGKSGMYECVADDEVRYCEAQPPRAPPSPPPPMPPTNCPAAIAAGYTRNVRREGKYCGLFDGDRDQCHEAFMHVPAGGSYMPDELRVVNEHGMTYFVLPKQVDKMKYDAADGPKVVIWETSEFQQVDKIKASAFWPPESGDDCTDACTATDFGIPYVGDGVCDDGGPGSVTNDECDFGTDCTDCGPRDFSDGVKEVMVMPHTTDPNHVGHAYDWVVAGTSYTAALLVKKDDGEYSIGGTKYKLELTSAPFTYPEGMEYGDIDTLKVIVTDPMAGEITLQVQADNVPTETNSDWIAIYKKDDLVEAFPTENKWSPNPGVAGTFKNTYNVNGEVPSCELVNNELPEDCEPAALKGKMVLNEYWPKDEDVMKVHALFDETEYVLSLIHI